MSLKINPNPNDEVFKNMSQAVKDNDGYCPCMIEKSEDTKCICKEFKEQDSEGLCHCERYIKIKI
jgi:hypothetical protein